MTISPDLYCERCDVAYSDLDAHGDGAHKCREYRRAAGICGDCPNSVMDRVTDIWCPWCADRRRSYRR